MGSAIAEMDVPIKIGASEIGFPSSFFELIQLAFLLICNILVA